MSEDNITSWLDRIFEQGARQIVETVNPYTLAAYHYSRDEYAMAREISSLIIENRKGTENEFRAVNLLGLLDSQEEQYDDAIKKYKRSIVLNPKFADAYYNWGYALSAMCDFEGAIAQYTTATELKPEFPDAYFEWGVALLSKGDFEGAITQYKKAIKGDPKKYEYLEESFDTIRTSKGISGSCEGWE